MRLRTSWKCGKYHPTIKAMTAHKRLSGGGVEDDESDKDDDEDEEEADEYYVETEFVEDDVVYEVVDL